MPSYVGSKPDPVPPVENGHRSILQSVEEVSGNYGDQSQFAFEIVAGPYKDRKLIGWADKVKPNEKNKLGRWLGHLSGRDFLPIGEDINTDDFIGQYYDVFLVWNKAGDASRVDQFVPAGAAPPQPAAAPPQDPYSEPIQENPPAKALQDEIPF